jgi:glutamine amidotransferase
MCQLFGLSSSSPSAVTFSFTGLSARGGRTGTHADGFGLAFHDGADCRVFIDEGRASDAPLAGFLRAFPIRARTVLAHVRRATQGPVQLANCHPFVREWGGRYWSFCHNGDLVDFAPRLRGVFLPVGSTDSERAFCWLLQELRRRFRRPPAGGWRDLAPAIAELAGRIGTHGAFNFLLSDGDALYVHCGSQLAWVRRAHPFATAQLVDEDLTLDLGAANGPGDHMVLVATEPLTRNEGWSTLSRGELRVFVRGKEVWRGQGDAPDARKPPRRHATTAGSDTPAHGA